jgi:hypothetical protein
VVSKDPPKPKEVKKIEIPVVNTEKKELKKHLDESIPKNREITKYISPSKDPVKTMINPSTSPIIQKAEPFPKNPAIDKVNAPS